MGERAPRECDLQRAGSLDVVEEPPKPANETLVLVPPDRSADDPRRHQSPPPYIVRAAIFTASMMFW